MSETFRQIGNAEETVWQINETADGIPHLNERRLPQRIHRRPRIAGHCSSKIIDILRAHGVLSGANS